ncbi:unnamed protein product [Anisakis simplex]|uniref:Decapping nuclease n=1 Tax=Anisakis simplex TaxID=6269 RepID=A0A0M3JU08_ANISI|nr:unnamed protein product [Anisakis simplex]
MTSLLLSVPVVAKESSRKDFPRSWNPDVFAEFSVTAEREVELNRAEARYFHKKILQAKEPNFDLNLGYDSFQSKDDLNGPDGEKLDVLCKWLICQAKQRGVPTREICYETDFVCYRGLLTRIASTPYDQREGWKLCAVRIGSTIFLCEFQTEKKKQEIAERTDRQKLMCYWGFKFEQFATTDRPNSEPNTSEAVSNLKEFDVVLRAKLGENEDGVRLMFAAETDCFDAEGNYLELKTVTSQNHQLAGNFWMMKAMKWWLQSYLAGIQRIIVGFRTWQGLYG